MSIRGSGRFAESSGELIDWVGCTRRLISRFVSRVLGDERIRWDIQHIALVRAPTNAQGSGGRTSVAVSQGRENNTYLWCLVDRGYRTRERCGGRVTGQPF